MSVLIAARNQASKIRQAGTRKGELVIDALVAGAALAKRSWVVA